jgi:hypothetical protein
MVGKCSEPRVKAQAIWNLMETARKQGRKMEEELISLKYGYPA